MKFKHLIKLFFGLFFHGISTKKMSLKKKMLTIYFRGGAFLAYLKAEKKIKKKNISLDDCLIYSYWLNEQSTVAWLLKKRFSSPKNHIVAISRAHRSDLYSEVNEYNFLPLQESSISNLDYIFPCSQDGASYLSIKYPLYKNKISAKFLGTIDHGLNNYVNDGTIRFVTCSNIIPVKRVLLFAEAFCILSKKYDNLEWTCIGDGIELETVRNLVKSANIENKVTFLGRLENSEVLNYYKSKSVSFFVNTSESEGLPVSIMEAMSFGVPCIATDVGGTSELVKNENGLLLNQNIDAASLSSSISRLIEYSEHRYLTLRNAARNIWVQHYSATNNYSNFYDKINAILNKFK
jgi:glycosyltransferase involved in cell wall biosynthesis